MVIGGILLSPGYQLEPGEKILSGLFRQIQNIGAASSVRLLCCQILGRGAVQIGMRCEPNPSTHKTGFSWRDGSILMKDKIYLKVHCSLFRLLQKNNKEQNCFHVWGTVPQKNVLSGIKENSVKVILGIILDYFRLLADFLCFSGALGLSIIVSAMEVNFIIQTNHNRLYSTKIINII